MAISMNVTLRNNRLNQITTFAGTSAILRIYSAAYAALLGECVCNATAFAAAAAAGVLTLNPIADGTVTTAGTAAIARIFTSGGVIVMEGLVVSSIAGSDIVISNTVLAVGDVLDVLSGTITEGNA